MAVGRGRPKIQVPDTPEFALLVQTFGSKKLALEFYEPYESGKKKMPPWKELIKLAREHKRDQKRRNTSTGTSTELREATDTTPKVGFGVRNWQQLVVFLRDLSKIGLPTDEVAARRCGTDLVRVFPVAPNVSVEITLHATDLKTRDLPLAHGPVDRRVMDILQTIAVNKGSRRIWIEEIEQFQREHYQISSSGGNNIQSILKSLDRIACTGIRLRFIGTAVNSVAFESPKPLIERGNLPLDPTTVYSRSRRGEALFVEGEWSLQPSENYFVELDSTFYDALTRAHEPGERNFRGMLPPAYLRPYSRSAKAYDFAKFIAVRCHEAQSVSYIPLGSIWEQLGRPDPDNYFRWRKERETQLLQIHSDLWKGCSARIEKDGSEWTLVVSPVKPEDRLIPSIAMRANNISGELDYTPPDPDIPPYDKATDI